MTPPGEPGDAPTAQLAARLRDHTLALVEVPSTSGDEAAILAALASQVPEGFTIADDRDGALLLLPSARREDALLVLLSGHVDTVPPPPGHRPTVDAGTVHGRGAADMKGGLAVAWALAGALGSGDITSDLDVGVLVVAREELPVAESALVPLLARSDAARVADLAIVLEPTANELQVGCMGNLNATVTASGTAAHSARPWHGRNAIHVLIEALGSVADLPVRDVEVEGLVFREVVSITRIAGGGPRNVVPDSAEADVNFRYAPSHTSQEAQARLAELLGHRHVDVAIVSDAPPGPVATRSPLVRRLRQTGSLTPRPKQAWTSVAEFAMAGVDAVNLGPGDPRYAHADDEHVEVSALVACHELLRAFLEGRTPTEEPTP